MAARKRRPTTRRARAAGDKSGAIEVFFVTDRDNLGTEKARRFDHRFQADGSQFFRVGHALVESRGPDDDVVQRVELEPEEPGEGPDDTGAVLGSRSVFAELRRRTREAETDIIVLLHGYSADFVTTMARAAQLRFEYSVRERHPEVLAFSWPADGELVPFRSYLSDRDDAEVSGIAMARALMRLLDFLREAGGDGDACRQKLQDARAFEYEAKPGLLPRLAQAVHLYHNRFDQALQISDITKGNLARLGAAGPARVEAISSRVFMGDCQHVAVTDLDDIQHQYYRLRREVIADVRAVLGGQPPDEMANRRPTGQPRSWRIGVRP